jgi:hypothetical protein
MSLLEQEIPVKSVQSVENSNIDLLNSFIYNDACVLLLGPLFGRDIHGNRVHNELKAFLSDRYGITLDNEFDNLCISRKSDGSDNAQIMGGIGEYFRSTERSKIYDSLIKIGFQSIISFSFDLFLQEANATDETYYFDCFNRKGNVNQHANTEDTYSLKPLIYNIFGKSDDLNSLIVDYDSLYDFLLNIISADAQIPLRLKDIVGKANAFLFVGFDMSKWYIPILIRKLNQFISNNRSRGSINGFVCLDDTRQLENISAIEGLNKYPLRFIPFMHTQTETLIAKLKPKSKQIQPILNLTPKLTTEQIEFFKTWRDASIDQSVDQSLDNFFKEYRKIGYRGEAKKEFEGQRMFYNTLLMKINSRVMSQDDFVTGAISVVQALLSIIENLLAETESED